MKKGQEFIGKVEYVDFPNTGIVKLLGEQNNQDLQQDDKSVRKITVKGTLPGQKIRFMISKMKSGKAEGRLLEVLEASPLESRKAACPHFGSCGGCSYQTLAYSAQLDLKSSQVKRLLDSCIHSDYEFNHIQGSPHEWQYRNKMEFSFGDEKKEGPLTLGLHKKGNFYDILPITACRIVDEDYNKILTCVSDFCKKNALSFYHKITHIGYLRHLLIRRAATTGEILVSLVTTSQWNLGNELALLEALKNQLLELNLNGSIVGILHTVNNSTSDTVKNEHTEILHGKGFFFEQLLGLIFRISTFSFFQTNSFGAEVLYKTVRDFVGDTKDKVIYDLYTGTGTIAQILAPVAKLVIGVEIVEEAVVAARENTLLNDLQNCRFIIGDVLKVMDDIEEKPDLIVLDPPRDGIHPKALQKILKYQVERIVYISCKPTSLARDLEVIQMQGYQVEKVGCVDMFPQNPNVETVVLLSHKNS